jgi:hypothetical protein
MREKHASLFMVLIVIVIMGLGFFWSRHQDIQCQSICKNKPYHAVWLFNYKCYCKVGTKWEIQFDDDER